MPSMLIRSADIYLRPLRVTDLDQAMEAIGESEEDLRPVMYWVEGLTPERELAHIHEFQIKRRLGMEYAFGVFRTADRKLLGTVGVHNVSRMHRRGELGYWVRSSFHGQGIARAASALMLLFAVDELGLLSVFVRTATFNRISLRLIKGLGFRRVGIMRRDLIVQGEPQDTIYFDMLAEQIEQQRDQLLKMAQIKLPAYL
ncbi:MAG: GNAT family protein [Candidatus Alcyoniella australis]|nr:GNAT family protein [Candidatus Alcyoniella australis]